MKSIADPKRRYYEKNKEIVKNRAKDWIKNNPERHKEIRKKYEMTHKEQRKTYNHNRRDQSNLHNKKYRIKNREMLRKKGLQYYYRNREKINTYAREWNRKNPAKILISYLKNLTKFGSIHNITAQQYHYALYYWSKTIKKKFGNKCQICHTSSKTLHAHHIFAKAKHPQLSLNVNNGVLLCEAHHRELHHLGGN